MRKATLWVCAAALALTGIACDDANDANEKGPVAPGVSALAAAADNASEAGSFAFAMTLTMGAKQRLTADAEGTFDFERQVGDMTMTVSGPGIPAFLEDLEIEMIVGRERGYMRMPAEFGLGRAWYRVPMGQPAADVEATGLDQLTQDPSQFLEFLRLTSEDDVEEVGTDEIRGVTSTHYEADVSFEKALEQAPNQEAVEDLESKMGVDLASLPSMPVDVWIDDDGLPRRIELAIADMEVSVDFFDYGAEVDYEVPAKSKKFPRGPRG